MKRLKILIIIAFAASWYVVPARAKTDKTPVLMVHGYFLPGAETWLVLKNRLIQAGWPKDYVMNPSFKNVVGCNPAHAQQIAKWVDELKEKTGADKVDLVAHSMGALDCRYYIKYLCGYKNVRKLVTIAGANHGTTVACVDQISCGAAQMCRTKDDWQSNDFLKRINACDETPGDVLYVSIWSPYDEIIRPPESSILKGAENIQISTKPVGHGGILAIAETGDLVIYALNQGGMNTDGPHWDCLKCDHPQTGEGEPADGVQAEPETGEDVQAEPEVRDAAAEEVRDAGISEPLTDLYPTSRDEGQGHDMLEFLNDTGASNTRPSARDVWKKAKRPDSDNPKIPSGGCDQGTRGNAGIILLLVLLVLSLIYRRKGLFVLLAFMAINAKAGTKGFMQDINPAIRGLARTRLKDAPIYRMDIKVDANKPENFQVIQNVTFKRPAKETRVLFYMYAKHPDLEKAGARIKLQRVHACGKVTPFRMEGPNLWVDIGACKDRANISISMQVIGKLAPIDMEKTSLGGEILREMRDMLSGSPSFELAFGAFGYGRGFYNFFGFYPLLAPYDHGWTPMKTDVLGDAPEPDAAFYDVKLDLPGRLTAAIPGTMVGRKHKQGEFHVLCAGFRHFSFALGDFLTLRRRFRGISVEVYVKKGMDTRAAQLLHIAGNALKFMQKHVFAYPNRRFLVVETPLSMGVAGLEASGLVYISRMLLEKPKGPLGKLFGAGLSMILPFVVAHETAHEWWAHLVGNSTWQAPFLDESLANEYALYFLEKQDRSGYCMNLCCNVFVTYAAVRSMGSADAPVSTPADRFGRDIYGYLGVVYAKGGYMMEMIRHSLGNSAFDRRMHAYARRFAFLKASNAALKGMLASKGTQNRLYNRYVNGKTGDQDICPAGLLFISGCMNTCMDGCMGSPKLFWKDQLKKVLPAS